MGVNTISLLSAATDPESASAEACRRLAAFFQPYPAKELARMFAISPKTAQTWRQGQWPIARHQHAIVQRFGRAWLDFVYAPLLPGEDRALSAQLAEIEGRLAAVRVELADLETIPGKTGEGKRHGAVDAAPARALAPAPGAALGALADGRSGETHAPGAGLAGVGARAGAVALALMVVFSAVPDQTKAVRVLRGGPARVVRVLRGPEVA